MGWRKRLAVLVEILNAWWQGRDAFFFLPLLLLLLASSSFPTTSLCYLNFDIWNSCAMSLLRDQDKDKNGQIAVEEEEFYRFGTDAS